MIVSPGLERAFSLEDLDLDGVLMCAYIQCHFGTKATYTTYCEQRRVACMLNGHRHV